MPYDTACAKLNEYRELFSIKSNSLFAVASSHPTEGAFAINSARYFFSSFSFFFQFLLSYRLFIRYFWRFPSYFSARIQISTASHFQPSSAYIFTRDIFVGVPKTLGRIIALLTLTFYALRGNLMNPSSVFPCPVTYRYQIFLFFFS